MANYLPVLLVSVAAGVPDDAALQSLPRGQVDYLSHDWAEEDVARSWRSMTKQKNEIANGLRLENASWRTWWKQRNKLKTVSPETLNWLKDSDVTWLYGPLHTAHDWAPLKPTSTAPSSSAPSPASGSPPASTSTSPYRGMDRRKAKGVLKDPQASMSLSSPSSSSALDSYGSMRGHVGPAYYSRGSHAQAGPNYERSGDRSTVMKPILKHRSISEMLTSALPPSPIFAHFANSAPSSDPREVPTSRPDEGGVNDSINVEEGEGIISTSLYNRRASFGGSLCRPPILHTKSDTNILPRFGVGQRDGKSLPRVSSPVAVLDYIHDRPRDARVDIRPPVSPTTANGGSSMFTEQQRIGAVGNLVDLTANSSGSSSVAASSCSTGTHASVLGMGTRDVSGLDAYLSQGTASAQTGMPPVLLEYAMGARSNNSSDNGDTNISSEGHNANGSDEASPTYSSESAHSAYTSYAQVPLHQKKHISFNAIVEQCIAIDGGTPDAVDLDLDLGVETERETVTDLGIDACDEDRLGALGVRMMKRQWAGEDSDNGYDEDEEDGMYEDVDVEADPKLHAHTQHPPSRGYEWDAQEELWRSQQCNKTGPIYGRSRIQDDEDDEDDDEDDEVLEIRTPSRRNSSGSLNLNSSRKSIEFSDNLASYGLDTGMFDTSNQRPSRADQPKRTRFRRTATNNKPNKPARSLHPTYSGSGSGSGSNSRSRSGGGHGQTYGSTERDHVSIAPIAPTVLKVEARDDDDDNLGPPYPSYGGYGAYGAYGEEGVVYVNSIPVPTETFSSSRHAEHGISPYPAPGLSSLGTSAPSYTNGYGYGGYGFGEQVSDGRELVREGFEQGPQLPGLNEASHLPMLPVSSIRGEPGELVYQAPDGSVHPWSEQEAIRFRTQLEFGGNISPAGTSPVSGSPPVRGGQIVFPQGVVGRKYLNGSVLGQPLVGSPGQLRSVDKDYFDERTEGDNTQREENRNEFYVVPPSPCRSVIERASPQQPSADQNQQTLQPYSVESIRRERNRTPSPDYSGAPMTNPRVATLRTEFFHGTSSTSTSPPCDVPSFVRSTSPTRVIPVSVQSPRPWDQDSVPPNGMNNSTPESFSTVELSPGRGRSPLPVSASGSAASAPSSASFGARSLSVSRSDSRGRSRTRNSSLSASSDMETERGRSRSRSTNCSGAASPLGDSSSPNTRRPSASEAPVIGITLGGGVGHSGREIRDGKGVRLYRKTSEDCIGRTEERGRNCESKRVRLSESLSPPTINPGGADLGSTVEGKVYGGYYKAMGSLGLHSSASDPDGDTRRKAFTWDTQSRSPSEPSDSLCSKTKGYGSENMSYISDSPVQDGGRRTSLGDSNVDPGSSTVPDETSLSPVILDEDEQSLRFKLYSRVEGSPSLMPVLPSPPMQRSSPHISSANIPKADPERLDSDVTRGVKVVDRPVSSPWIYSDSTLSQRPRSSDVPLPSITKVVRASSGGPSSPAVTPTEAQGTGTFANRAADIMSSARNLLGTIWNGSAM